ncbi:MAG: hypothetical protein LBL62_10595 [Planctomycetaceae bacterium]|nr:hypothetical protein [Planctomycetaceae bacterium]
MVSLVHNRRSLTCGYENTAFQAEKKIRLNSYSFSFKIGNQPVGNSNQPIGNSNQSVGNLSLKGCVGDSRL